MKARLLQECLKIARDNNTPIHHPEWDCYKHYAFIIQDKKILTWDTNRRGSALLLRGYKESQKTHAETNCWAKAKGHPYFHRGYPFEMVNIRLSKLGAMKISKPCFNCIEALKRVGCWRIWYSIEGKKFKSILLYA